MTTVALCLLFTIFCCSQVAYGNDAPNILDMLDGMNGGTGLTKLTNLLKEFKIARAIADEFMEASPLYKKVMQKTAQRNVKADILYRILMGKMPDLEDLYKLSTSKSDPISKTMKQILDKNQVYQEVISLMNNKTTLESATETSKLITDLTGKKVNVKQSFLLRLGSPNFKLTSVDDFDQLNLLESLYFLSDNQVPITQIVLTLGANTQNYTSLLIELTNLDYSHLRRIVQPPQTLSDKYSVGSLKARRQNPLLVKLTEDLSTARVLMRARGPSDEAKAEALSLDIAETVANIVINALRAAEDTANVNKPLQASTVG